MARSVVSENSNRGGAGGAPPILHEADRGLMLLRAWLAMPVLIALLVVVLRDPQRMGESWARERGWWLESPLLGGSDTHSLVARAEDLRDAWLPQPNQTLEQPKRGDIGRAATLALRHLGERLWQRAWLIGQSYLPMLLVRLMVVMLALPAVLAACIAAWWGSGVAANRRREAVGAFPQAGLHLRWWRLAAVCGCAIGDVLVVPVAYGPWWIAILAALSVGTAVSLHYARAHGTTTVGQ